MKAQNHFVEKMNVYSHMLKSAAVPPTLGAEVYTETNKN